MSTTTEITRRPDTYALGHTPQEYERLRAQARDFGPGETTRLLAQRVGPGGRVLGMPR